MLELEPGRHNDDDDDSDVVCQSVIPPNPWSRRPGQPARDELKPAAAAASPVAGIVLHSIQYLLSNTINKENYRKMQENFEKLD